MGARSAARSASRPRTRRDPDGDALGKGEEIAEALFATSPEELTPEGCDALANKHALDPEQFRRCFADPATDARIRADSETFRAAKGHGLPRIYIDGTKLEGAQGAQDKDSLQAALDGAIKAL